MDSQSPNPPEGVREYWWYRETPDHVPKVCMVRSFDSKVRVFWFSEGFRYAKELKGEWRGPIHPPFGQQQLF